MPIEELVKQNLVNGDTLDLENSQVGDDGVKALAEMEMIEEDTFMTNLPTKRQREARTTPKGNGQEISKTNQRKDPQAKIQTFRMCFATLCQAGSSGIT